LIVKIGTSRCRHGEVTQITFTGIDAAPLEWARRP
jgi:hypothetical protein